MNQLKKDNVRFQEEAKTARLKEEKAKKRLQEITNQIRPFGSNLCKVLDLPEVTLSQQNLALPMNQPQKTLSETQVDEFLKTLLRSVQNQQKQFRSFTTLNQSTDAMNKESVDSSFVEEAEKTLRPTSKFNFNQGVNVSQ